MEMMHVLLLHTEWVGEFRSQVGRVRIKLLRCSKRYYWPFNLQFYQKPLACNNMETGLRGESEKLSLRGQSASRALLHREEPAKVPWVFVYDAFWSPCWSVLAMSHWAETLRTTQNMLEALGLLAQGSHGVSAKNVDPSLSLDTAVKDGWMDHHSVNNGHHILLLPRRWWISPTFRSTRSWSRAARKTPSTKAVSRRCYVLSWKRAAPPAPRSSVTWESASGSKWTFRSGTPMSSVPIFY